MGVMYGRVRDHAFWITDAAALPVQGTETRVNAGNEVSLYRVVANPGIRVHGAVPGVQQDRRKERPLARLVPLVSLPVARLTPDTPDMAAGFPELMSTLNSQIRSSTTHTSPLW